MRAIVIDDDEDLRFATALALKTGGYAPLAYPNCSAAAEALASASWRPGLILLDIHLEHADMTPAEFVAWLHRHGYGSVPVLVVSASVDTASTAQSLGASAYLHKPFDLAELMERTAALAPLRLTSP